MDKEKAVLIVSAIDLLLTKGIPTYIEWQDGVKLENPTIEDFEALKVKKMSDKAGE